MASPTPQVDHLRQSPVASADTFQGTCHLLAAVAVVVVLPIHLRPVLVPLQFQVVIPQVLHLESHMVVFAMEIQDLASRLEVRHESAQHPQGVAEASHGDGCLASDQDVEDIALSVDMT